jgi:uncharacterized protein YcgI (DUF1989 family)
MRTVLEQVIPPKEGFAVTVRRGQHLRVTDLEGKQVVDMALFNEANPREKLSTSNSRTQPVSRAGDYVEFRAEMDLIVGLSNCPLDVMNPCNGYKCTPVKIEVYAPA